MALSDKQITRYMEEGRVVIEPFTRANLSTSSYDVTLGPYYFRANPPVAGEHLLFNPYDEEDVTRVWGEPQIAESMQVYLQRTKSAPLKGIKPTDEVIFLRPMETILAHTNEFIGGRAWESGAVTTMMKARSSFGRSFIETCKCAGWGDVGYVSRWTMEITNNSSHYTIPLVVGRRIAQIVFFETGATLETSYEQQGKYQCEATLEEVKKNWRPQAMLPKCFLDREVRDSASKIYKLL